LAKPLRILSSILIEVMTERIVSKFHPLRPIHSAPMHAATRRRTATSISSS
jgi:hypothetical protein